jgi:hypothetical protein
MPAPSLCRECDGAGWIPYYSETVDGELEEAYRLCPNCYTPRYCMGKTDQPCLRPATVRYGLGYYCKEHIETIHAGEGVDHTSEAIYYLRCWLRVARDRANEFKMQLSEALSRAETCLGRAERELDQA